MSCKAGADSARERMRAAQSNGADPLNDGFGIARQTMEQNVEVWFWIVKEKVEVLSLALDGQNGEKFLEQIVPYVVDPFSFVLCFVAVPVLRILEKTTSMW